MSVSILDMLNVRHAAYDIFADLFLYKFKEEEYNELLGKLSLVQEKLGKYLMETGVDVSEILRAFKEAKRSDYLIEYSTLFMTGLGVKPLIPVESKRIFSLMGEKVALFKYNDVVRFMKSRGLVPKIVTQFSVEIDHVSSILGFMAYLVEEEFNLRVNGRDAYKTVQDQKNFAITHIFSWIPDWASDVVNDQRARIFKVVCTQLQEWLKFDRDFLGER
ncbi:putative component of anaerobic dehydrogenase [Metallosphaera yellowstonensis MK1]|uniref:Putative component of anaerobic dehydrogenase n=1 Tax=Metallosphaera yellowstonensis MK1 TaxID=671065 RepID=H2C2Q9_9CREN|nr:molecular chaperone TorD family protein [Metallosphaera yellowstonensis]EHP70530.1 putative component of anaerobic dehydrogenase [Metallosphaera yellowstonensis MK1]